MKLHAPIPHRKARIEIIPLIDIMFFLLASFMLVSMSMIKLAGVKMSLPQAATAQPETKPDFIPISISPGGEVFRDIGQSLRMQCQDSIDLFRAIALLTQRAGDPGVVPPIRLRFFRTFENVCGDAALFEGFAEFDAQEA